jgi:hypothetical protein
MAKLARDQRTEDMTEQDVTDAIRRLTGEEPRELLQMAGRQATLEELRRALHHTIVMSNELGQHLEAEGEEPQPKRGRAEADPATVPEREPDSEVRRELAALKTHHVDAAKALLISLASSGAADVVIIASLDALVDLALKSCHKDCQMYQNLRAHTLRLRGQLSLSEFLIDVLGDKVDDRISSAISKGLKEQKMRKLSERKEEKDKQVNEAMGKAMPSQTPNAGLPPNYQWLPPYHWSPYHATGAQGGGPVSGLSAPVRFPQNQMPRKRKLSCYACGGEHLMRECDLFKQVKKGKE